MKKGNLPDFSGKCLSITIRDDSANHDLFDPHFEYHDDILFLVGTVPKGSSSSDWAANKTGAIPWARVTEYFVFDDLKDFHKAVEISENYRKKKKKKKKKKK